VVFLGFYREASAIVREFELMGEEDGRHALLNGIEIDHTPQKARQSNPF